MAVAKLNESKAWLPAESFEVNFVALWQTEEYKNFAPLQQVKIGDSVKLYFPDYDVNALPEEVVKTVYNVLADRYDQITLNELPSLRRAFDYLVKL